MIILTYVVQDAQSFSECFSALSYIRGNTQTFQLDLHLVPFEELDKITSQNLCQIYLPGKDVVVKIHYNDVSFPKVGDPQVKFVYAYNTEIIVSFQLSQIDYNSIINKQNAMYELWYDINLIKVNNSVGNIQHTKYNGTGCFSAISMSYSIYGDIDILTTSNNCLINYGAGVTITLDYLSGTQNKQLPVYPCTAGCVEGEYNDTSTTFQDIKIYRAKKTNVLASNFADFYASYIANRIMTISFNMRFDTNGIESTIMQLIDVKTPVDTWGCVANDPMTDTFYGTFLGLQVNPNGAFLQIRDAQKNILICDTSPASKVNVDIYMMQGTTIYKRNRTFTMFEFNEQVGVQFESDAEYQNFRDNILIFGETQTFLVVSYVDANDIILYEITNYLIAYTGCIAQEDIQIYDDKLCAIMKFENTRSDCVSRYQPGNSISHVSIYFIKDGIFQFLGQYNIPEPINYTAGDIKYCFNCDILDPVFTYAKSTCAENWALTKQMLKKTSGATKMGLIYASLFENYNSENIIAMYNSAWTPFIVTAVVCVVLICIAVPILMVLNK
ncbi:Conserved_hypothetical protein [Hexamita inflata]|uniref:Transmembrane protein n=1 Tax=Hexamita inflata TaxID=28002 RepID=A0AA86RKS8_9EUKA|nr:Conserved hypothetical protein [Hexamita inflata]